jgi:MerR family transcriptional regulator, mercuric resistance operon regulatory protein
LTWYLGAGFRLVSVRTGQLARQSGVNVQTLRYYERRGLLQTPPRLPSGYREYAPDAVGVVRFVKRAQELGFSLDEVESLLNLAGGGPANCDKARGLASEKLAELEGKIVSLRAMQGSLRRLVATCEKPRHQRECPLLDALAEGAEPGRRRSTQ